MKFLLPADYAYCYTRDADIILQSNFNSHLQDLADALDYFYILPHELEAGLGNQNELVKRFTGLLTAETSNEVWQTEVEKTAHKTDIFTPGIAIEVEWNNKDPFFYRDLLSFNLLYKNKEIAVGVIVTRGRQLQMLLKEIDKQKYGESTTHLSKLMHLLNTYKEEFTCPLMLIGIEPPRIKKDKSSQEHYSWQPDLFEENAA